MFNAYTYLESDRYLTLRPIKNIFAQLTNILESQVLACVRIGRALSEQVILSIPARIEAL